MLQYSGMDPLYDLQGTQLPLMLEECRVSDISSRSKRITPRRPIGIRTEPPDFIALMIHEHIKLILSISSVMSSLLQRNRIFSSASAPSSLEDFKFNI